MSSVLSDKSVTLSGHQFPPLWNDMVELDGLKGLSRSSGMLRCKCLRNSSKQRRREEGKMEERREGVNN